MQRSRFVTAQSREDTADVVSLWRLQSTYADIITRRAWTELASVFAADVTIEVDTATAEARHFTGPQEFIDFVGPATERFDHFEFVILNTVVEIDRENSDVARGRIFMCEIRSHADTGEWSTAYGLYQDTYRRIDGTWWITDRRYRSLARTGSAAGVFGIPAGLKLFDR
jgi:SnoaL-like domain